MSSPRPKGHQKAVAMLLVANLFWGLSFPLIKALLLIQERVLPPGSAWFSSVYVVAPRFVLGALVMALLQLRSLGDIRRSEWVQGSVIGAFAMAGMLLQNDALKYTAASTSAFLTQFYAILIPVWLAWRQRRNPGLLVWTCAALVLAGVAILGHFDWSTLRFGRGEWETLACSLFYMVQILWLDKPEYAGNRAGKITLVMFSVEGAALLLVAMFVAPSLSLLVVPWTYGPWVWLTLALTLFCTLGSFSLMNGWQPKVTATEAGLIYCVEPIFGSIMALFLPALFSLWSGISYANEHMTWTLVAGGGLITAANILLQTNPPRREP